MLNNYHEPTNLSRPSAEIILRQPSDSSTVGLSCRPRSLCAHEISSPGVIVQGNLFATVKPSCFTMRSRPLKRMQLKRSAAPRMGGKLTVVSHLDVRVVRGLLQSPSQGFQAMSSFVILSSPSNRYNRQMETNAGFFHHCSPKEWRQYLGEEFYRKTCLNKQLPKSPGAYRVVRSKIESSLN
jgi:hypothetical protein